MSFSVGGETHPEEREEGAARTAAAMLVENNSASDMNGITHFLH